MLAPELAARRASSATRFQRECELAASLDHPNVVPDLRGRRGGTGSLFIAMRYVEGSDLGALLRARAARSTRLAPIELVAQAGDALDAAHRGGLLHRDVKPSNILVAEGRARVPHGLRLEQAAPAQRASPAAATSSARSTTWRPS